MDICKVDKNLIYTGEHSEMADLSAPVPRGWIATAPPVEDGIWQWQSTRWGKLDEYPPEPTPAPVVTKTWYSPDKIIIAVDAMGKAAELETMLAASSPRIRMRWQKALLFDADDEDFRTIVSYIQTQWGLTDEQKEQLLASCETEGL